MLKQFLYRWLVNFLGLWAAAGLLGDRINYSEHVRVLLFAALIFSVVNALIRPLIIILALPAIVLTLGLFTLVINGLMLYLVTVFYHRISFASFGSAVLAAAIIWVVNYLLTDLMASGNKA